MNAPAGSPRIEVDDALLRAWPLPLPGRDADKGDRGLVLVVAGSREMPGAAWLAGVSALRAGAGRLVVATAASVASGLALRLPEARVIGLPETAAGGLAPGSHPAFAETVATADAVVVGPGLQDEAASCELVRALLQRVDRQRLVLDALAIEACGPGGAREAPPVVLPHAGEMAHLLGARKEQVKADAETVARRVAADRKVVVVLKGATTHIADPEGTVWRHVGGNVGLATSGSGDTLAGMVGGLLARGAPPAQAAVWGVALHARAGESMARRRGPIGYLARELPGRLPALMQALAETPPAA